MNNILKTIKIDLYSPTSYEVITAQQGDHNSRIIELILFEQGQNYKIPENITLGFMGFRGNGSTFFKDDCISINENHIFVTLTNDILYYAGTIEAKIVMYNMQNRSVLSTIPFQIICQKSPCHESGLSNTEKSIITDLIFKVEEFSKAASQIIQQSERYANTALISASAAANSAETAKTAKTSSAESASNAASCANIASEKAITATNSAKTARSYACGDTDLRPNESTDNAKYYYTHSKAIYDDFSQAGNVVGVKGNAQTEYKTGFVNLTPENIGALPSTMGQTINNAYNQANAAYERANFSYDMINSDSLCLGNNASDPGWCTTTIGGNAITRGNDATALGYGASAGNFDTTALGCYANASKFAATAVGCTAKALGNYSTALGYFSEVPEAKTNTIQLGNSSTLSELSSLVPLTVTSDERDKTDITEINDNVMEFLKKIKAIRYVFNPRNLYIEEENLSEEEKENKMKFGLCKYDKEAHAAGTKKGSRVRIGVSAQQVQSALKEVFGDSSYANLINDNFFDLDPNEIPEGIENQLSANYEGFIPFLIKAVQELSDQIDNLKELKPRVKFLEDLINHE